MVVEHVPNPSTTDASSPNVSRGNALILVPPSRYELGAPCPKFSELLVVPAYQLENRYLRTIILIYKLRKLSMFFPTSSSLTKMNLAYRAAVSSPLRSRFSLTSSSPLNLGPGAPS